MYYARFFQSCRPSVRTQSRAVFGSLIIAMLIVASWGSGCRSVNEYNGKNWIPPNGLGDGLWHERPKAHSFTYTFALEEEEWYDRQVQHVYLDINTPKSIKDIQVVRPDAAGDATIEVRYFTGDKDFGESFEELKKIGGSLSHPIVRWGPDFFDYQIHPDGKSIRGAIVDKIIVTIPSHGALSHLRFSMRVNGNQFFEYKDKYNLDDLKEMYRNPSFGDEEKLDAIAQTAPEVAMTWFQFIELLGKLKRDASKAKALGYHYETLEYAYPEFDMTARVPNCTECIHSIGAAFATKELALDIFEQYKSKWERENGQRFPVLSLEIPGFGEAWIESYTVYDPVANGALRLRLVDLYLESTKGTTREKIDMITMFTNFFSVESIIDTTSVFEILKKFAPRISETGETRKNNAVLISTALFNGSVADQARAQSILMGTDDNE